MSSEKCLCGKEAVCDGYLPIGNVYAGVVAVTEKHVLCRYHGEKAESLGHWVEWYTGIRCDISDVRKSEKIVEMR